jgi:hypothetical protein
LALIIVSVSISRARRLVQVTMLRKVLQLFEGAGQALTDRWVALVAIARTNQCGNAL